MHYDRIVNKDVSMSNIKAAVELFLRNVGEIKDSETMLLMTFGTVSDAMKVVEWDAKAIVPVQFVLKTTRQDELITPKEEEEAPSEPVAKTTRQKIADKCRKVA